MKNISIERISVLYNKIRQYKQLFPSLFETNSFNSFEQLSDYIENKIIETQKISFVKSFISTKYQHLINDETVELFNVLKKENNKEQIRNAIMVKIASFKSAKKFNKHIQKIIDNLNEKWSVQNIIKKVNNTKGASVIFSNESIVLADIKTYEAMQSLGSENWCIKRDRYQWKYYVENTGDDKLNNRVGDNIEKHEHKYNLNYIYVSYRFT